MSFTFALALTACGRLGFELGGGQIDAACTTSVFYADVDGDGHGDPTAPVSACTQPTSTATSADDCDDRERYAFPGNPEVCDGVDNDCTATTSEACSGMCVPLRRPAPDEAHTYLLCGSGLTRMNAEPICASNGFHLATIDDAGEHAWLRTTMDATHGNVDFYVGGTDAVTEGVWLWADGSQFWMGDGTSGGPVGGRYANWGPFEPNNGSTSGPENCLLVLAAGSWNDADCDPTMRQFACERE